MSENSFKYYAFISYSHKDEDAAEDIQKKLSFYRMPGLVRKENPLLPKHLRPIFRDKTNLNAGLLQESLRSELDVSKFLIVICSPNSADSYWVNEEVKHFIEIGRKEYIIPVIVDGEPQSVDSAYECLCPALKRTEDGDEFLGINVIEDTSRHKEESVARIAAKLLGLDFDTLWDWQKREQKRRTLRRRLLVGAAVVAVLASGLAYWHLKLRVTNKYFVNYVDKWGMPTGIHELSKKDIASRNWHYHFEYKAGRLRSVTCENSLHKQWDTDEWEYSNRPTRQELEYDQKDRNLISINNYYSDGSQARYEFRNNYNRVNITNNSDESAAGINGASLTVLDESIFSSERTVSPITSYSYERDEKGFITREYFRRHHNAAEAACTIDGILGLEYEHNADGSIRSISYLGKDGEKRRNGYGVAKRCYEYDEGGDLIKASYFDIDGNPVCNESKWASKERVCDANGNSIKVVYKDVHGKVTMISRGHAVTSCEYNQKGFRTKECYYDEDEKLIYGYEYKLDENGWVISQAYIGDDGKPKISDEGYAIVENKYDSARYLLEKSFFDADGKPVCNKDGIARTVWNDMGGRKSWEQLYFDDAGKPACYPG
ncbi:MAG: toll/interleukin-1 receptor domain-containing protein, partial [Treponema sp.]|nr:toll/interleukin-1 receptor domain-containing protein [Treponema sp.]